MVVSLIVAVSENQVIGKNNDLIWHLPNDMKHFKDTTLGHCVIMGRKNFESIPHKYRPLPNRTNVVVSRQEDYLAPGATVTSSVEKAIELAETQHDSEPFVIGGGEIYKLALERNLIDRIYLTRVHESFKGDTIFPKLGPEWKLINTKKKFC
jgi:dihydrofolate reductase